MNDDKFISILIRNYWDFFPDDLHLEEYTDIGRKKKKSKKGKVKKRKVRRRFRFITFFCNKF